MSAFVSEAVKQTEKLTNLPVSTTDELDAAINELTRSIQTSIEKATKTKFIELNAKTSCWSSRDELSNSLSQSVELGEDIRRHTQ